MNIKDIWFKDWRAKPKNGDYYDDKGLLVCGKCGKRRECFLDLHGGRFPYLDAPNRFVVRPTYCDCNDPVNEPLIADSPNMLTMDYEHFAAKYLGKTVSRETTNERLANE